MRALFRLLLPVLLVAVIDSKATEDLCSQDQQALLFRESGDVGVAQCTMQVRQPRHKVSRRAMQTKHTDTCMDRSFCVSSLHTFRVCLASTMQR